MKVPSYYFKHTPGVLTLTTTHGLVNIANDLFSRSYWVQYYWQYHYHLNPILL